MLGAGVSVAADSLMADEISDRSDSQALYGAEIAASISAAGISVGDKGTCRAVCAGAEVEYIERGDAAAVEAVVTTDACVTDYVIASGYQRAGVEGAGDDAVTSAVNSDISASCASLADTSLYSYYAEIVRVVADYASGAEMEGEVVATISGDAVEDIASASTV